MSDKRCCATCKGPESCRAEQPRAQSFCCKDWQRNPDLWLDILPESNDYWFWREDDEDLWKILKVLNVNGDFCVWDYLVEVDFEKSWVPVSEIGGQWQGPIRPK